MEYVYDGLPRRPTLTGFLSTRPCLARRVKQSQVLVFCVPSELVSCRLVAFSFFRSSSFKICFLSSLNPRLSKDVTRSGNHFLSVFPRDLDDGTFWIFAFPLAALMLICAHA